MTPAGPTSTIPPPVRAVLLNPGPVNVDPRVREALAYPDVCHREPEVTALLEAVRDKATRVCGGDTRHTGVVLTGSGTAALEAALTSAVPSDGQVLVLDNGHYGQRLAQIVEVHGIACQQLRFGWAVPTDLAALDTALAADPGISHVAMVHHETSTGMLNPVRAVGEIVARHGRELMVDAISSVGAEDLDVVRDRIGWCVGTANKALEGLPGVSFVVAPRDAFAALADLRPRSFSLDLHRQYLAQHRDRAPAFTPAVQILYAFDRALDLTLVEGVAARTARYAGLAQQLRAGLADRGFTFLLGAEHRSNSITTVRLPAGLGYDELHDRLKRAGFVIYAAQGELAGQFFRLANMGQLTPADIASFLQNLDRLCAAGGLR